MQNADTSTTITEEQFLKTYDAAAFDRPTIAVDNLLFAVEDIPTNDVRKLPEKRMQILLVKRVEHPFIGMWSLPGTFLKMDETFEQASMRCFELKLNIKDVYLEQLYSFGDVGRDPRTRIVSVAYIGLINKSLCQGMKLKENSSWFSIKDGEVQNVDKLAFDHAKIVEYGLTRIRSKLEYSDIAFSLLPKKFTLAELRQVYELILGKKLQKVCFQRKIKDKVVCLNEYQKGGFRPALLYKRKF